jgi:hypothetical protein
MPIIMSKAPNAMDNRLLTRKEGTNSKYLKYCLISAPACNLSIEESPTNMFNIPFKIMAKAINEGSGFLRKVNFNLYPRY